MIEYRDMTFCPFYIDCVEGTDCMRALTPDVEKEAEKLGLPICKFIEKPDCYKEIKW